MAANGASPCSSAAILSGPRGLEAQTDAPPGGEGDLFVPQEEVDVCDRLEPFWRILEGIKSEQCRWKMKQQSRHDRLFVNINFILKNILIVVMTFRSRQFFRLETCCEEVRYCCSLRWFADFYDLSTCCTFQSFIDKHIY